MAYITNRGLFEDQDAPDAPSDTGRRDDVIFVVLIVLALIVLALVILFGPQPHHYRYRVTVPNGRYSVHYRADTVERLPDGGILVDGDEIHGSYTITETP